MTKSTSYIGRDAEGSRVFIQIELRERESNGRFNSAETHEPIEGNYLELSIMGSVVAKHSRSVNHCGQIEMSYGDFSEVTPVPGTWTRRDIASMAALWDAWHLNGMEAGCNHMTLPADKSYDARRNIECEAGSGYTYGSAWLVRDLPAEVIAEVQRLQALPRGDVPDYV